MANDIVKSWRSLFLEIQRLGLDVTFADEIADIVSFIKEKRSTNISDLLNKNVPYAIGPDEILLFLGTEDDLVNNQFDCFSTKYNISGQRPLIHRAERYGVIIYYGVDESDEDRLYADKEQTVFKTGTLRNVIYSTVYQKDEKTFLKDIWPVYDLFVKGLVKVVKK